MKWKLSIYGLLALSLFSCSKQTLSPLEELKQIGETMKEFPHVEYAHKIDVFRNYSGKSPTEEGKIYFENNQADTIIGMKFYSSGDDYTNFYNGEFLINTNKADSSVFKRPLVSFHDGHGTMHPDQLPLYYSQYRPLPRNDKIDYHFCSDRGMDYSNVRNGSLISKIYRVNAAPIYYLLDKQGKIVYSQIGHDSEKLIKNVEQYLN